MESLAKLISAHLDRPVIDKTGLAAVNRETRRLTACRRWCRSSLD
jgi:hypothetical protein